jgi:hypothetical protein
MQALCQNLLEFQVNHRIAYEEGFNSSTAVILVQNHDQAID